MLKRSEDLACVCPAGELGGGGNKGKGTTSVVADMRWELDGVSGVGLSGENN